MAIHGYPDEFVFCRGIFHVANLFFMGFKVNEMLTLNSGINNKVHFGCKNKLITPSNTELKKSLGEDNLLLLDEIRMSAKTQGAEVYLFGGAVRDCLLGKTPNDLDVLINADAVDFTKKLNNEKPDVFTGAFLKPSVKRAVAKSKAMDIDINPLDYSGVVGHKKSDQRRALRDNTRRIDYTVNSMFIKLGEDENGKLKLKLIDISGGKNDLKNNVLRHVSNEKFETNPVAAIRGFRLAKRLGMKKDKQTHDLILDTARNPKSASNPLASIKEFYKLIKEVKNPFECINILKKFNIRKFF